MTASISISPLSAEQTARIEALNIALKMGLKESAVFAKAAEYEAYILKGYKDSGDAGPKRVTPPAAVPATAGKAPAGERTSAASKVPAASGDASDKPYSNRRPSERVKPHGVS